MTKLPRSAEERKSVLTATNHSEAAFTGSVPARNLPGSSHQTKSERHSFSKTLAEEIAAAKRKKNPKAKGGWHEATLLKYLANRVSSSKHLIAEKSWFYASVEQLAERLPYFGDTTIYDLVVASQDLGYLETGNYNRYKYDRTLWFHVPQRVRHAAEQNLIYFDSDVAEQIGVVGAVLKGNFDHWIKEYRKRGKPLTVEMSPSKLTALLPFGESTVKRGLKSMDGRYARKLSKTEPIYGVLEVAKGPNPNRIGSNPNDKGPNPNGKGPQPNDNTSCKPVANPLLKSSKGEPAALPLAHTHFAGNNEGKVVAGSSAGMTTDAAARQRDSMEDDVITASFATNDVDHLSDDLSARSMDANAGEQQRSDLETSEMTSRRSVFLMPRQMVAKVSLLSNEAVDTRWPYVASFAQLHERTSHLAMFTEFAPQQHRAKDEFRTVVKRLCRRTMDRIDKGLANEWFEDPDGDTILRGLLPAFHEAMQELGIDPCHVVSEISCFGALECLVGSFLTPRTGYDRLYNHPMVPLIDVTRDLYLDLWDRERQRHEASVAKEFAGLKVLHASRDEHKEDEADRSPAEKTRIFRNGLNAMNAVGWLFYDQTHRTGEIKRIGPRALKLIERLFELNPQLIPADLLRLMERCMKARAGWPTFDGKKELTADGKLPYGVLWHVRRGNDLIFFVTNLHLIVDQLRAHYSCGVEEFLNGTKNKAPSDDEPAPFPDAMRGEWGVQISKKATEATGDKWRWEDAPEMNAKQRRSAIRRCIDRMPDVSAFSSRSCTTVMK